MIDNDNVSAYYSYKKKNRKKISRMLSKVNSVGEAAALQDAVLQGGGTVDGGDVLIP